MKTKTTENSPKRCLTIAQIAFHCTSTTMILSVMITGIFVVIALIFSPERFMEYIPLFIGMFLFFFLLLVVYPILKSVSFIKLQERILDIRYHDRDDLSLPAQERDWFFASRGPFFVLLHRQFIMQVNDVRIIEQESNGNTTKIQKITFIDCNEKKQTIYLESLKSELRRFQAWLHQTENPPKRKVVDETED